MIRGSDAKTLGCQLLAVSCQLFGECLRSCQAADDRRDAGVWRQVRAAVDCGDGEVQLRAARLSGERDANRVKERLPLLPRALPHPRGGGTKRVAIERAGLGEFQW